MYSDDSLDEYENSENLQYLNEFDDSPVESPIPSPMPQEIVWTKVSHIIFCYIFYILSRVIHGSHAVTLKVSYSHYFDLTNIPTVSIFWSFADFL